MTPALLYGMRARQSAPPADLFDARPKHRKLALPHSQRLPFPDQYARPRARGAYSRSIECASEIGDLHAWELSSDGTSNCG